MDADKSGSNHPRTYFLSVFTSAMRAVISSAFSLSLKGGISCLPDLSFRPSRICRRMSGSASLLSVKSFTPSLRATGVRARPSGPCQGAQ